MINAFWESMNFEIPTIDGFNDKKWYRVVDTALSHPDDFPEDNNMKEISNGEYLVQARSVVVLKQIKKDKTRKVVKKNRRGSKL